MQKSIIFIWMSLLVCAAWAGDEYRDFTNTKGQTVRGRIVSFDARKDIVQIEPERGKKARIPLSALIEKDQEYVRSWQVGRNFMDDRRLKISAKRRREDNEGMTRKYGIVTRDVENMSYEILLENASELMFENVEMQYCIYYEQEESAEGGNETRRGVYCGKTDIETLTSGSKQALKTEVVLIYKAELDSGYYYTAGSDSSQDGEVHGIWLRLTMELPGGEKVVRDFSMPDSIPNGHKWTTTSVKVGMN